MHVPPPTLAARCTPSSRRCSPWTPTSAWRPCWRAFPQLQLIMEPSAGAAAAAAAGAPGKLPALDGSRGLAGEAAGSGGQGAGSLGQQALDRSAAELWRAAVLCGGAGHAGARCPELNVSVRQSYAASALFAALTLMCGTCLL